MLIKVDIKGRLYLPKKIREKLGVKVYLIELKDGLLLIPRPEDPLRELEAIGKTLPEKSIKELKQEIISQAEEELK